MFTILVNAAFYLEEIQQSDIIINQTNTRSKVFGTAILRKTDILIKLTKNLVIIASSVWTKYLITKNLYPNVCIALTPPYSPPSLFYTPPPLPRKYKRNN